MLSIMLRTLLGGMKVGEDALGNGYYTHVRPRAGVRHKRWVIYKPPAEASSVCPLWHAWLHHRTDALPDPARRSHPWEKPHQPNQTHLPGALSMARTHTPTLHYEPWIPQ